MTHTTKFVYIKWLGEGIPFARRGRYSVLQSDISPFFNVGYDSIHISPISSFLNKCKLILLGLFLSNY